MDNESREIENKQTNKNPISSMINLSLCHRKVSKPRNKEENPDRDEGSKERPRKLEFTRQYQ